ncbi:MAG: AAA family ATPase, partial [Pseudomonadota bacterium]
VRYTHATIELEHWILALTEQPEFSELLEKEEISVGQIRGEAQAALEVLKRGASGAPAMSVTVIEIAREAWLMTSLRFDHQRVTLPALLLTMAGDSQLRAALRTAAPSLLKLNLAGLEALLAAQSAESAAPAPRAKSAPAAGGEDFLAAYATDLTEEARAGRIDHVIGRDAELRQMVDILMRRRQNNPILVGEAGVGKTAIVEAFARMIADGEAPGMFGETALMTLDLSLLQAGAGVKGEFERRLKGVVDQVKASPTPVILFIDEAHTIIGAGGQQGQGDAANILKPALARGELRTIAATTWAEYKKYFEKDPALTRRFQTVKVDEPDVETAVRMMRAIAPNFRKHHEIRIRDSALRAAVELSHRYLPGRQLPDKAVSLIDTAAASVAMSRQTVPAALADARREVELLEAEIAALEGEPITPDTPRALKDLRKALGLAASEAARLEAQRHAEEALIVEADGLEADLGADQAAPKALAATERKLGKAQGEAPLVHRLVDAEAIAAVVA